MAGKQSISVAKKQGPDFVGATPSDMAEQEVMARNVQANMDDVLAAGINLGRLEALDFVITVSNSAILPIYENVKKTKAWALLRNPQNSYGENFSSLDEFCDVKLGKSYKRLQALLGNRNAIGHEAFEQAEKLGLRQIDYNAIKALPAPKQAMIKEALTEGADIETVTRALRQLAAEDQREIEALTKDLIDIKADYEAQGDVIRKKDAKINERDKELHKLRNRAGDWHPRATEIAIETTRHAAATLEALDKLDAMRNAIMTEEFGDQDREAAIEAMAVVYYDAVGQIAGRLAEVMADCEEVFVGYKDKARPMLNVEAFVPQAAKAEEKPATKAKK